MELQEKMIQEIVRQVLTAAAAAGGVPKQTAACGAFAVQAGLVKTEPFQGREDVRLKDLATLEESPRMGAGIMELLDQADFEWTLTYDEYDYVISGVLEIVLDDGTVLTGRPGDVLYIPRNTHIHFRTPSQARYAYIVYPANWQEIGA